MTTFFSSNTNTSSIFAPLNDKNTETSCENNYQCEQHETYKTPSLVDLVDNSLTDKNTAHSYLPLYETFLSKKRETAKNVLEVGIFNGGSIKLWSEYFTNAMIYGVDFQSCDGAMNVLKDKQNVKCFVNTEAYDYDFIYNNFITKNIKFDFILDDGFHSFESMVSFIKLYLPLLTDDGVFIIEDVFQFEWLDLLKNHVPEHLKKFIKTFDLRKNKNRHDDIVFMIDMSG